MENEEKKIENDKTGKTERKSAIKYLIAGLVAIIVILVVIVSILLFNSKNDNTKDNDNKNGTTIENNDSNISVKGSSYEELIKNAEEDEKKVVANLEAEFENLKKETDTYDKYVTNKDKVKLFYDKIVTETDNFGIRLREYSLKYAELIMQENISSDDK